MSVINLQIELHHIAADRIRIQSDAVGVLQRTGVARIVEVVNHLSTIHRDILSHRGSPHSCAWTNTAALATTVLHPKNASVLHWMGSLSLATLGRAADARGRYHSPHCWY